MGCVTSCACAHENYKLRADREAYSMKHPRHQATYKRKYRHDSSSGVLSAQSNPTGRDVSRRNSYRPEALKTLEFEKQTNGNMFPTCDDFHELAAIQQQWLQKHKLFDYDLEDTTDVSTITNSRLLRTQEISENISINLAATTLPPNRVEAKRRSPTCNNLLMEPTYKRNYCYDSSSGVSSAQLSPAGRDISRSNCYRSDDAKTLECEKQTSCNVLPICDDYHELAAAQQQLLQKHKLFDYDLEDTTDVSTITNSRLLRTQEISENMSINLAATTLPPNRVEIEECMKPRTNGLMPKISSPICQRQSPASNTLDVGGRRSGSYEEWINCLEDSSCYMPRNDVVQPSKVLRGRCSSLDFSAY